MDFCASDNECWLCCCELLVLLVEQANQSVPFAQAALPTFEKEMLIKKDLENVRIGWLVQQATQNILRQISWQSKLLSGVSIANRKSRESLLVRMQKDNNAHASINCRGQYV